MAFFSIPEGIHARLRNGDIGAVGELSNWLCERRPALPEDRVQDVLAEVLRRIKAEPRAFALVRDLNGWVSTVLRRGRLRELRSERRRACEPLDSEGLMGAHVLRGQSPESAVSQEEICSVIRGAIARLPHAMRVSLERIALAGDSHGDVGAELFGVEPRTGYWRVASALCRGRGRLRKLLAGRVDLPPSGADIRKKICADASKTRRVGHLNVETGSVRSNDPSRNEAAPRKVRRPPTNRPYSYAGSEDAVQAAS